MTSVRPVGAFVAPRGNQGREPTRRQGALLLLAITLIGTLLRVLTLNSRSFWLDEATSVRQASWTLPVIFERMSKNVHPPLFHILIHNWVRYVGRDEVAFRSFALILGVLAIPLAYWVGTTIYNRRVGVFSAATVALSPYFIWYSQEARMYTLMLVFAMLSTGSMYRAIQSRTGRWWVAYALFTTAGMFTHYFFAFLVLTQGLYVLVFLAIHAERDLGALGLRTASWRRPWRIFSDCPGVGAWLLSMVVVLLPHVWWIPKVVGHDELTGGIYQSLSYGATATAGWHFNDVILAVSQALFGMHSDLSMRNLSAIWPLAITAAFLMAGSIRRVSGKTWYLIYTGVFGALMIAIIGQWEPVYEVRYFTAVAVPLVILFARLLAELRAPMLQVACAALLVIGLVGYADQSYNPDSIVKWDNREAMSLVYKGYQPGDVVLVVPYYASSILEYYLPPSIYFAVRPVPIISPAGEPRNSPEQLSKDLSQQIGPARRVWLVSSFVDTSRIAQDRQGVAAWLEQRGYRLTEDFKLHRIEVALYEGSVRGEFFVNQGGGR